jgi:DNA-binding transcriptional LysR family regulator
MELGSTAAVKEAVIAGFGFSILSKSSVLREIADGLLRVVPIRGLTLGRDFYEVTHRQRTLSPVSHAFRRFLEQT